MAHNEIASHFRQICKVVDGSFVQYGRCEREIEKDELRIYQIETLGGVVVRITDKIFAFRTRNSVKEFRKPRILVVYGGRRTPTRAVIQDGVTRDAVFIARDGLHLWSPHPSNNGPRGAA